MNKKYRKASADYPLQPLTSDWMHQIMNKRELLNKLVNDYGSPINLHHLKSFKANIDVYQNVFRKLGLDGQIYFARKANKCKALVKASLDYGIGVDTASFRELDEAIRLGGNGENLVLTAAIKNEALLELALKNNVPIIIDNQDELELTNNLAQKLGLIGNIGLRLSGFRHAGQKLYSRFGFDIEKDIDLLKDQFLDSATYHNLCLTGFHFHLDGYSIPQRSEAILQILHIITLFNGHGHKIKFLDIGGGILMNYLESKEEWGAFNEGLKKSLVNDKSSITHNNDGLGYYLDKDGNVTGKLRTYPYYNEVHKAKFLEEVLSFKDVNKNTIASLINNIGIQIRIEPGRSLLDQVGLTIAKVIHRKKDSRGDWHVGLEMNMSQLKSSSADFLLDPFIVPIAEEVSSENEVRLYFTGAYCLESDVILKRKLTLPYLPAIGDLVVFVNTAGYMMHFYETEAHMFGLSKNLIVAGSSEHISFEDIYPDSHASVHSISSDELYSLTTE